MPQMVRVKPCSDIIKLKSEKNVGNFESDVSTKPSLLVDIFFCETKKNEKKNATHPLINPQKEPFFFKITILNFNHFVVNG